MLLFYQADQFTSSPNPGIQERSSILYTSLLLCHIDDIEYLAFIFISIICETR